MEGSLAIIGFEGGRTYVDRGVKFDGGAEGCKGRGYEFLIWLWTRRGGRLVGFTNFRREC